MLAKAFHVFTFQMRSIGERILMVFGLVFLFVWSNMQPVADFAVAMDLDVTPWGFPHVVNDWLSMLVIMAGAAALFCDAPFRSDLQNYILPRAGQRPWVLGHILYILVLSFLYVLVILIACLVPFLARMDLQMGWGKVWGTLARTTLGSEYGVPFRVNDYLVGAYHPASAAAYSFLLTWTCCVWLGLLTYFVNSLTGTYAGTFASAGFVLMDVTVANEWLPWFYKISPVTMAQLHTLKNSGSSIYRVTPRYAVTFFLLTLSFFAAGTLAHGKGICRRIRHN